VARAQLPHDLGDPLMWDKPSFGVRSILIITTASRRLPSTALRKIFKL
jgi:hypothetical protein